MLDDYSLLDCMYFGGVAGIVYVVLSILIRWLLGLPLDPEPAPSKSGAEQLCDIASSTFSFAVFLGLMFIIFIVALLLFGE